ncbi:MAG TPA: OpgC domain-containing protein [Chthoniobacterales bacterium]|nr:OpgC domain-containing protein [Chthoniobacterales bacterium]
MKRLVELDVLRGFLLLMMVVNHAPSPLRRITDQPFGFFSTAEGFVFVSAFLAGLLFQKRAETKGFAAARTATLLRALRIYQAHLLSVFFIFVVGGIFLSELPGVQNILSQFFANPTAAIAGSVALLFQPPLLDILPMYIVFSFLTPLAFWAGNKWGWRKVFLVSSVIWLVSQFRIQDYLIKGTQDLSFIHFGPFDLFSWQLIWIGGLIFGRSVQERKPVLAMPRTAELALLVVAIVFLVWRWVCIYIDVDPGRAAWFLDKWHLGPLRVLNFFAVAWFAGKLLPHLRKWSLALRPICAVGENMLPIFSTQVCVSVFIGGLISVRHHAVDDYATVLVLIQIASVFLAAWVLDRWRSINSVIPSPEPA